MFEQSPIAFGDCFVTARSMYQLWARALCHWQPRKINGVLVHSVTVAEQTANFQARLCQIVNILVLNVNVSN